MKRREKLDKVLGWLGSNSGKGKKNIQFPKVHTFQKIKWRERKRWTRCSVDWKACAVSSVRPLCEMLICTQLHQHTLQFCAHLHSCAYISIWKYVFLHLCEPASIEQSAIAKATKKPIQHPFHNAAPFFILLDYFLSWKTNCFSLN